MSPLSLRARRRLACRMIAPVLSLAVSETLACGQADGPPPRIVSVTPTFGGIADQSGVASVDVTFSEPVLVSSPPLAWGAVGGVLPSVAGLLAGGTTMRVTFSEAVLGDRLTIVFGGQVTDLAGNPLDGEVTVPGVGPLPSGDGMPGGLAVLRYDILKGDANGDGLTNPVDVALVVGALGACAGDPDFDSGADLNQDGCVNVLDVQIVLSGQGGSLPPLDGLPPTIASISRADGAPLTEDLEVLAITFSEELNPLSVIDGVVSVRDLDGTIFAPATTVLAGDGRTIECYFAPPISACGNYTVAVSNAIADLSGELFVPPAQAPGFTGSTPPATPVLNKYTAITSAAGVTISGTIPQKAGFASAVEIRIQGPDQILTAPVAGNSFSATMPLEANEINYLYVSATSPCGIASAPIVAEVTRDNTAPNLTIQFPSTTQLIFDEAVNVGGTVGDTLSGFEGLTVSVNGQRAVVDIALGQNGTWLAENVPLNRPGQPTTLTVIGTDIVGNQVTQSITVTRASPPRNAAYLEVLSGDDQVGLVGAALRTPIAVKVWKGDGTPFANKLVDFRVTQNDGRLSGPGFGSGTMLYQVLTDASGVASATWTLGSTAGCGNHRVEATAKEVAGIARFSATATADTPDQINIGSGNNQRVEVGAPAPLLLSAWVSDATNPVASVPVTFTVTSGGGLVNGQSQITVPSNATGHADVEFTTGPEPGVNRVEATFAGNRTNPAVFTTYGIKRDFTKPTSFRGLVLDNASRPIGNVKISLKFGTTLVGPKLTNEQGQFEFTDLTNDGAVHVIVEGFLANKLNGQPLPPGVKFPSLGYDTSIVPNAENTLGKPILLPPMLPENTVTWNGQSDIEITCAGIEGLVFRVKANSMTLENGTKPTVNAPVKLSLNQVHHDDIPMPMPNGVAPAFAWTFQPPSATFDPPVEIEYPNMSVLPPGAMAYFLTFNHDLGEFEIMAPGRVSEDGSTIVTEPGTGLRLSGWGCNCPPYSVTGDVVKRVEVAVALFEGGFVEFGNHGTYLTDSKTADHVMALDDKCRIAAKVFPSTSLTDTDALGQLGPAKQWYDSVRESQGGLNPPSLILYGVSAGGDTVNRSYNVGWFPDWQIAVDPISRADVLASFDGCAEGPCSIRQLGCVFPGGAADVNFRYVPASDASAFCATIGLVCFGPADFPKCACGYSVPGADIIVDGVNHYSILSSPFVTNYRDAVISAFLSDREDGNGVAGESLALNGSFSVGIAGQATQLGVDGTFSVQNVNAADSWGAGGPGSAPDFLSDDYLRIIGCSEQGGVTKFVFSEPFQIEAGKTAFVDSLTVTTIPPLMPAALALSGPQLLEVPTEAGLATTATMNDGSTVDATPATFWTTYRTSNPNIATVDKDGVVTAHQQGTVFITALNNAATAVKKILVTNEAATTTIVGFVQLEDGTPVENAVLVTPLGGKGVSGRDGAFSFEVEVGQQTSTLNVTAVASIRGVTYTGTKLVSPIALEGVSDAGAVLLTTSATCAGDFQWLPTFGGERGMNGTVRALAVFDDGTGSGPALYAGGEFTTAGGVTANRIAKWNGTSWSPLGTGSANGVSGGSFPVVNALTVFDDGLGSGAALYAGGLFTTAGGVTANGVARWDGSSWLSLGTGSANGTNGEVYALTGFDDGSGGGPALYAGGSFGTAGGVAASRIAKWNGTSWSSLGAGSANGVNNLVKALTAFDDGAGGGAALYVGGDFTLAGGVTANRIAKWSGTSWSPLGSGSANGVSGTVFSPGAVNALTVFDDGSGSGSALYAGGSFTTAGGVPAKSIAKWNGTSWSALAQGEADGVNSSVYALTVFEDGSGGGPALYAGGGFTTAGGATANGVAKWNGTSWSPLGTFSGNGVNGAVLAMTAFADYSSGEAALYTGGMFTGANTPTGLVPANRIATWNGTAWSSVGTGLNKWVSTLTVFDDRSGSGPALFVGGEFTVIDDVPVNRIAKWDGDTWSALGSGVNNWVHDLATFDDGSGAGAQLYAGGRFTTAGGVAANFIARWDGTSWHKVGNGTNNWVRVLKSFDDGQGSGASLYVGGEFTSAGSGAANRIARWNGTTWSKVGSGANNSVYALEVFDDGSGPALYAGGYFTASGGVAVSHVMKWSGTQWSAVGLGTSGPVLCLAAFSDGTAGGSLLCAGGAFAFAAGVPVNNIAVWDGAVWAPLGVGMNGAVWAVTPFDDGSGAGPILHASGQFTSAGGVPATRIARWDGSSWSPLGNGLGGNGSSSWVYDLAVVADSMTGLPSLYAGGDFVATPAGDSYLARWTCVASGSDAPNRPHGATASGREQRSVRGTLESELDRTLRRGESLIFGDESVRFGTLTALAGSTLRLTHLNAHLAVTNLIIEPGATFEWIAGTIEIDAGAWLHPYELTIGCDREAKLLLTADAFVRAPQVTICGLGSLVGQGSVDAPTTNAGTVAGDGSGLRVLGPYGHEPSGTIAASVAELAAIAADQLHPCEAVDELNASNEIEPIQRIDVDRDGDLDLVRRVRLGVGALSFLWLDRGDGSFGTPILCGSDLASQRVSLEHLDDDGLLDLLITSDEGLRCHALSGGAVEVLR